MPHILPGGRAVIFTISKGAQRWDDTQVVVRSLTTGQQSVLIEGGADGRYVPTGHLVYLRLGTLMAAPFDLERLAVSGGATGIAGEGVWQDLQRDIAIEPRVAGPKHLAHPAYADRRDDLVAAESSAWRHPKCRIIRLCGKPATIARTAGCATMDRPERTAAIDYLRRKGTDAPVAKLLSGLRSTFRTIELTLDRVPEALRPRRPAAAAWSVHEVVDHLVETHRPAVLELRALCAGVSPDGGPIPARLRSAHPFDRPWAALVVELKDIHAQIIELVEQAGHTAPVGVKAPFVMVVKGQGPDGPEVIEWVDALDWKAYAQALRIHTHEHGAQVERTVAALSAEPQE